MTTTDFQTELNSLQAAWARSDELFALAATEALLSRPIPLRQPILFYVGHLPAFAWNHLWRGVLQRPGFADEFDALFERGIDPPDDGSFVPDDAAAWPAVEEVLAYRDRVRHALRDLPDSPEVRYVLGMVIEHEVMHHETLLYILHQLPAHLKRHPRDLPERRPTTPAVLQRAIVPAGVALMGAPRDGVFRWDNEHPEVAADVAEFGIDTLPVTNRVFREFVQAGGYRQREWWSEDGWQWRERHAVALPSFWRGSADDVTVATLFEEVPFAMAADWPVYVTHCEASAYARWKGGRLPAEAEFHRAAFGTPEGGRREHPWGDGAPGRAHGNLAFAAWEPVPVGSYPAGASAFGVHELVGNGWEWTSTPFRPYPGFAPYRRYPGYSADFFDDRHFVMLGGSWATDARLVRRSLRNWFQPHYPYVFAKFRCAWLR